MIDSAKLYLGVGERIRRIRDSQTPRMSQGDLAEILGLQRTSITNIELGNQKLTLDTLFRLCDHFGLELNEVVPSVKEVSQPSASPVFIGGKSLDIPAKTAGVLARLRPISRSRRR